MKAAALLLLVLSLSFAGEAWKVDVGGGVGTQPLVYGSRVIIGTSEGKVFGIEPPFVKWSYSALNPVVCQPVAFGDKIIIATSEKVIALNQFGALQWETSLPGIRNIAVSDKIYVSGKNGIQALNADGTLAWNFAPGSEDATAPSSQTATDFFLTAPLATPNYVFFGHNDYVYAIRNTGAFAWKTQVGRLWNTPPLLIANTLHFGTSEGLLYSLDILSGAQKSKTNLFEQVSTTPVGHLGAIIVGTSGNTVYSASGNEVTWSTQLDGKISSRMHLDTSTPEGALYITTTRSLYGLDPGSGTVLFKRSFVDWPSPPAYLNGQIIVGTEEGAAYGIDSSKACSILSPEPDSQVGSAPFEVSGLGYSKYGGASTQLRIGGGEWISLEEAEWSYPLDPSGYPYGLIDIECRVSDSTGQESEPYTTISVVHIAAAAPELMTITYPQSVRAGEEFSISVQDKTGTPLSGVKATAGGATFTGDGELNLSLSAGLQKVKVERAGYKTEEFTIDSKDEPTLAYVLGALFIILLAAYIYFLFIRKLSKVNYFK